MSALINKSYLDQSVGFRCHGTLSFWRLLLAPCRWKQEGGHWAVVMETIHIPQHVDPTPGFFQKACTHTQTHAYTACMHMNKSTHQQAFKLTHILVKRIHTSWENGGFWRSQSTSETQHPDEPQHTEVKEGRTSHSCSLPLFLTHINVDSLNLQISFLHRELHFQGFNRGIN